MIVLSVYTSTMYKEMHLPVINDSDYSIYLNKDVFGLKTDVELILEVINNTWRLKETKLYRLLRDGYNLGDTELTDNCMLQVYTADREILTVIARDITYSVAIYDKYDISTVNQITMGKKTDMDICYDFLGLVSREHTEIIRCKEGFKIINKSTNGIYINSKVIHSETILKFGDHITIVGLNMVFLGNILAIDNSQNNVVVNTNKLVPYQAIVYERENNVASIYKDSRQLLHRAPRNIIKIEKEPIEIESVPPRQIAKKQSVLQVVGSSLTMSIPMLLCGLLMIYANKQSGAGGNGLFMYTGIIMSMSSALLSIIWTLVGMNGQKKQEHEEDIHRFDAYSKYLIDVTEIIKQKYNNNMTAMHTMYRSAEDCTKYDVASGLLWNRNSRHEDFLMYRLGLGNLPFQAPIMVAKEKFSMAPADSLLEKPAMIKKNFETLFNVPVCVDLKVNRLVGVVGGENKLGAVPVIKLLATQIAANNCYTDVKMIFVYNKNKSYNLDTWDFVKWFPHVWSEDKKIRYVASDKQEASDVFYELAKIFRQRDEAKKDKENSNSVENSSSASSVITPHYIMFLMDPDMLEGELIAKYAYSAKAKYGLSTIIVTESYADLPNSCEYVIENDDTFKGKFGVSEEIDNQVEIKFDEIADKQIEKYARQLSNVYVKETEVGGDIPSGISFFEMYGVKKLDELNVLDRWRKNRTYDNIKGLLGESAGGNPCYLDVHEKYHGPHGLVAGTTGSGKSETLQTYMLSLAVNYSPDDIGFFIIDYKGGGMANLFNGLPHLIGQISNLSGNQVRRAMVSIKSENRRRQRIFNESGVNNINLYTKLYKNNEASIPVPHLFIIIDEFAELKREEPDFMRELISVAQVGRSLGVHLILATQKPSGTVDDNIWSNTKFRLCLRVADKQDSNDMLHKPDAAFLTQAGRCYLQVGSDEVFELFQSGFSGATYTEDDVASTDIAKLLSLTGHVDMTGNFAKSARKEKKLYDWLSKLAYVLAAAMEGTEITIEQCVYAKNKMQHIIEKMFPVFESYGIEYPISQYNAARLEDYINAYYTCMQYEGDIITNLMNYATYNNVKLPQEKEKTQLDAVKEYLADIAVKNGYVHDIQLWMPVLPTHLYLDAIPEYKGMSFENGAWPQKRADWDIDILVGMYDDPQNQAQMPVQISFSNDGHFAVCGMVSSGRSTSLQTIAYALINKYDPSHINIYAIDFSSKMMSAFENAPHVGGVMYEGENEKIAKFFTMINSILAERKKLFRGGNYSQYVQVNGVVLPAIMIFVDNVGAFIEKTAERYLSDLITLSKEGVSHGIYLVLSGGGLGSSDIPNKIADNIKTIFTTEMAEKFAYADVMHSYSIEVTPESGIKGRGLAPYGNAILEYQTALAIEAQDDYSRLEKISMLCEEMSSVWTGKRARPIPEIPEKPVWSEFAVLEEYETAVLNKRYLPVAYNAENASVYSIDLSQIYCYLITGHSRSGKKNFMRVMIQSALKKDAEVCIIDGPEKTMHNYADSVGNNYITDEEGIFRYFSGIIPEFKKRNQIKRELLAQDLEEIEIFEAMSSEKPMFIFISDYYWFIKTVYEGTYDMKGFLENITEKGRLHNIFFFGLIALDKIGEIDYMKTCKLFIEAQTGIHFGGNVGANRFLNYESVSYKDQTKVYKPGIGMTSSKIGEEVTKIVVPLARR